MEQMMDLRMVHLMVWLILRWKKCLAANLTAKNTVHVMVPILVGVVIVMQPVQMLGKMLG